MALPGVTLVLQDQFYALSRQNVPSSGPVVVGIGSRSTANMTGGVPDLDPYTPTSAADAVSAFGYGSQAHRCYVELLTAGASHIVMVALPQGTTDANLTSTTVGNVFDTAFAAAESALPDIIVPWGRGGDPSEWNPEAATPATYIPPPFGFRADNATAGSASLAGRVAQKCYSISSDSKPVLAILGLTPYVAQGVAQASANVTTANLSTYYNFPNLIPITDPSLILNAGLTTQQGVGQYLSVVSTELIPLGYDPAWGYANGACQMAGLLSQLASSNAPTAKVLANVTGLRYAPTRTMQTGLLAKSVIPVALNAALSPYFVDGMTFAEPGSDYVRITTMRIVFDAVNMIRDKAQGFVGQGMTLQARNALETAITSGLRVMQQSGALLCSDFTVNYVPAQNLANVNLVLTPAFELRTLNVNVSVNLA